MAQKVFIPATEESVFDHEGLRSSALIPLWEDADFEWKVELNPADVQCRAPVSGPSAKVIPFPAR